MNRKAYLFLLLLVITSFFVHRSALPPDIMEQRNLVTAREMSTEGHWLLPTMNGNLRLEKPPLPTWVAGVVDCVAPHHLVAQRFMSGIMATAWLVFFFLFVRDLSGRDRLAFLSALIFLTMYQTVLMGRSATWDIYCHAFMMGGIFYLERGLTRKSNEQWKWFPAAGAMMGLSFLSKGPVSFYALLLPVLIATVGMGSLTLKDKWPAFFLMVVLVLLIGGSWYVWLLTQYGTQTMAIIHQETGAWGHHNVRPWYYYWRFFAETGIWAFVMLAALAVSYWKRTLQDTRTYLFSITWTLAALVLLSLMPEKKYRYLLPMMPACSLCIACLMDDFVETRDKVHQLLYRIQGWLTTLLFCGIGVALPFLPVMSLALRIVLSITFVFLAVNAAYTTRQQLPLRLTANIAVAFMLAECFLIKPVGKVFGKDLPHSIVKVDAVPQVKSLPFYHPKQEPIRIKLVYLAGRKILPVSLDDSTAVVRATPFVLVTEHPAHTYFPQGSLYSNLHMRTIARYDDNTHPMGDKGYKQNLVSYVTIITR